MAWTQDFLSEAKDDVDKLDHSVYLRVQKALDKTAENPLPQSEGGYGKPLGNHEGMDLSGLLKVKLKRDGVRIIYKLERTRTAMKVIVVGVRSDSQVYREAARRKRRHNL